jgi:hypothetical protein
MMQGEDSAMMSIQRPTNIRIIMWIWSAMQKWLKIMVNIAIYYLF